MFSAEPQILYLFRVEVSKFFFFMQFIAGFNGLVGGMEV